MNSEGNIIIVIKIGIKGDITLIIEANFQLNIFCNNSEINANTKETMKLLNMYNDYEMLPENFQELSINGPTLRPRLISENAEWALAILSDRISIVRNSTGENITIEQFITRAMEMASIFLREYKKRGKRISFATRRLLEEMSPEMLNSVYDKFVKAAGTNTDISPFEWNARSVRHTTCNLSGRDEKLNFITNIGRSTGTINENGNAVNFDRVFIDVDINTVHENDESRFNPETVNEFIQAAALLRESEMNELERVING